MKHLSFILATYICLLMVQPVAEKVYASFFKQTESCSHDCCKHKPVSENNHPSNNCCDDVVCNPFGMCNCCFVFNSVQVAVQFNTITVSNKLVSSEENNLISSFSSDCFHPPEFLPNSQV